MWPRSTVTMISITKLTMTLGRAESMVVVGIMLIMVFMAARHTAIGGQVMTHAFGA